MNSNALSSGTIFDVSAKTDVYGPGKSYNVFAGKDGSRGLGLSSLKEEDAIADYSQLDEKHLKVLDDWHVFFSYVHFGFINMMGTELNNRHKETVQRCRQSCVN